VSRTKSRRDGAKCLALIFCGKSNEGGVEFRKFFLGK
ncbi:MAG: hypothetical protein ACI9MB_000728, partial [Verrucomicrobiales bacterium]